MQNTEDQIYKEKNSKLSLALIMINILLLFIFFNIGMASEDQKIFNMGIIVLGTTILVGAFAFSYHGKQYRIAKWIFGLLLLVSIVTIALLAYLIALGHAFKN